MDFSALPLRRPELNVLVDGVSIYTLVIKKSFTILCYRISFSFLVAAVIQETINKDPR